MLHYLKLPQMSQWHTLWYTCVSIEGFVVYIWRDFGLHLKCYVTCTRLWAYVMSDMLAREMIVGYWTCALESGPLIGAPAAPKLVGG